MNMTYSEYLNMSSNNPNKPVVTFESKSTPMKILANGNIVGEIRRTDTKTPKYVLSLHRVYWKGKGKELQSNTHRGGDSCTWTKTVKAAKGLALSTLWVHWAELKGKFEGSDISMECDAASRNRVVPRRGHTPIETSANAERVKVDRYLVVWAKCDGLDKPCAGNFGFFNATSAEESRQMARKEWGLSPLTHLDVLLYSLIPEKYSYFIPTDFPTTREPLRPQYGKLAQQYGDTKLPLKVCQSAAGYYLGTEEDGMPFTRESAEYWRTKGEAEAKKLSGNWTQRPNL